MGKKITIREARESGAVGVLVYCATTGGCSHHVEMTMLHVIALWGADARLDDLPLYCAACGSRSVDVRPNYESTPDNGELHRLMREAWDRKR